LNIDIIKEIKGQCEEPLKFLKKYLSLNLLLLKVKNKEKTIMKIVQKIFQNTVEN